MIVGLFGKVIYKDLTKLHIDVNSITYEVFTSFNCSNSIELNRDIRLHISEIIKEDSYQLYGFLDSNEKLLFDRLIKISGVGGRVAIAICSYFTPSEFNDIIKTSNVKELKKVSGIGEKSARKILLELGEFEIATLSNSNQQETILALESLGFKRENILNILKDMDSSLDTAQLVKEILKRI